MEDGAGLDLGASNHCWHWVHPEEYGNKNGPITLV